MLATFFVVVLLIFPVVFGPSIDLPYPLLTGNPMTLTVKISNENLTPFTNFEYTCELEQLELASGVRVTDATVVNKGHIVKFDGRKAINARCETAYLVNAPIKNADYKLMLNYRVYPWTKDYTKVFRLAAVVDARGQVSRWVQK